ncbi:hypothetical protein [Leifsonia kafniensis]|uniref:alpha/beta fold hydrolase n=1 Tax=Leifsonia kafniensis TaxID=475957 RepID=UPI0031E4FDB3
MPDDLSREAYVSDDIRLIEVVVDGPVDVVDQSMSGHTAMLVAARRPDLVNRLVLLETSAGADGDAESQKARRPWPTNFARGLI